MGNYDLEKKCIKQEMEIESLKHEIALLKNTISELYDELAKYKKPNARGAGRKKANAEWMKKYIHFCNLMDKGTDKEIILIDMDISSRTYYRLKKMYLEDKNSL